MIIVLDDEGNVLGEFKNPEEAYKFAKERMKEGKKFKYWDLLNSILNEN
jgi:hypothetical protein